MEDWAPGRARNESREVGMQTLFKLAAAAIVAVVLVVVVNVYGSAVYNAAARADVPPDARPKMAAAPKADAQVASAPVELRAGDAELGKKLTKQCVACHTFEQGGANKVGPNLWGVAGANIAMHDGFKYSDALATHGGQWTDENLDHWVTNPKDFAKGTKMSFAGIKDPQQRLDLIAYLHTLQ